VNLEKDEFKEKIESIIVSVAGNELPEVIGAEAASDIILNLDSLTLMRIFVECENYFDAELDLSSLDEQITSSFSSLTDYIRINLSKIN